MKHFLFVIVIFTFGIAGAQSQSTFKRTTATILFSSIGGGVLGLSTLSFYGKPQEHTDNITTGVLVGFIAGLSYVMFDNYIQNQANAEPSENQKIHMVLNSLQGKKEISPEYPLWAFQLNW